MTVYTREYQRLLFELQHLQWRATQYGYTCQQVDQDLDRLRAILRSQDQHQQPTLLQLVDNFRLAICAEIGDRMAVVGDRSMG